MECNNIQITFIKDFDYFLSAAAFRLPNGIEGYAMIKNGMITIVKAFGRRSITSSEEAAVRLKIEKYIERLLNKQRNVPFFNS